MKLHLLGTTGYHPNNIRHTACYMIPEAGLVLDAGTGFFRVREFVQDELDVFVTHAHLDHIVGLTFLFDVIYGRTMKRVTVHGRAADLDAIQTHLLAPALFPVKLPIEYRPIPSVVPLKHGGTLTHFTLEHPGGAIGYRLDFPQGSLAYVSDTVARRDAEYVEAIRGVDWLVHECYFPDAMSEWAVKTGHSWTSAVAQVAKKAEVKRLILVHLNPYSDDQDPVGLDVARSIFPDAELGYDGMVVPLWPS
ncbi:MAG TPA: MBL fold metallo-hydrolase [Pirellulales bacterium]